MPSITTVPPRDHDPFDAILPATADLCRDLTVSPSREGIVTAHASLTELVHLLAGCAAKSMATTIPSEARAACVHDGRRALACVLMVLCAVTDLPVHALAWWPKPVLDDVRVTAHHVIALGSTLDRAADELGLPALADPSLSSLTVVIGGA